MGYFSNLSLEYIPCDHDYSYPSPEQQLLWRLADLEDRLAELVKGKTFESRVYFNDNELRYILPEHLKSATDVEAAIELAIRDLAQRYGIYIREEPVLEAPVLDEITGMQISILDILATQTISSSAAA